MSNFRRYIVLCVALIVAVGCAGRKTLSDEELARIFHDAFLSNAYSMNQRLNLDSLRLYEPIFERYGYTTEDVQYTIGSFSTRKSAKLSDVVERAIKLLEEEGRRLDAEVAVLDTLQQISIRRTTHYLVRDTTLELRRMRDTSAMKLQFEGVAAGTYYIQFDYLVDSLDTTPAVYRMERWVENRVEPDNEDSETEVRRVQSVVLSRNRVAKFRNSVIVDEESERLVVRLLRPTRVKGVPSVKIKNLSISRVLTAEEAQDSLYRELIPLRIFSDELQFKVE